MDSAAGKICLPKISDTEYIDEWGLRRVFTGMYWDIVENPLRGATLMDLENYPFPDPYTISQKRAGRNCRIR